MPATRRTLPFPCAVGSAVLLALFGCHRASDTGSSDLGSVPLRSLTLDLRIGSRDDPNLGFTRPTGVDVDRDGNVYVAEASAMEIRVYTPDGKLLRRFGRRGDGPGEFQTMRFGVVGDTVWAFDLIAQRITLFDREGKLLSARRVTPVTVKLPPRGEGHILPWRMRPDGLFTSSLGLISYAPGPADETVPDSVPIPRVLFDATGSVVDTVGWDEKPPPRMWRPPGAAVDEPGLIQVGSRQYRVPQPPTELPTWLALDDGEIRVSAPIPRDAEQGTVTVTRTGLGRDTVYDRHLTFKPVPYTSADLDSIASRYARTPGFGFPMMGGSSSAPSDADAVAAAMRNAMKFPDFHPGIQYPRLDQDDRVWLPLDLGTNADSARWIILDTDGRPMGAVDLPPRSEILWSRGDVLWTMNPDDMDVLWLVRYRMGPS